MKNKKTLTIISVALILTVLVIVVSFFILKEKREEDLKKCVAEEERLEEEKWNRETKELEEEKKKNEEIKIDPKEKMVWYEIPEIKMRFLVTEKLSKELLYVYKIATRTIKEKKVGTFGTYRLISFSTKTLESISPYYCAAKNGPLGTLSIINGNPNDYMENTPISRADKIFDNFYIQLNNSQAPCLSDEEYYTNKERLIGLDKKIVMESIQLIEK